jgi:hypothetical protein
VATLVRGLIDRVLVAKELRHCSSSRVMQLEQGHGHGRAAIVVDPAFVRGCWKEQERISSRSGARLRRLAMSYSMLSTHRRHYKVARERQLQSDFDAG